MTQTKSPYHGHRFPEAVISHAVRGYFRFRFSLRDIEELLFEPGMMVSYETIHRRCEKFGASFAHRVKAPRRTPGTTRQLSQALLTTLYCSTDCLCRCGASVKNLTHSASLHSRERIAS